MTAQPPLRAALAGCGRIGAFTREDLRDRLGANWLPLSHAEAIRACEGMELVASCDPDGEARGRMAGEFGITAHYDDAVEMLNAQRPDLLAVATRSDVRPAILRAAAACDVKGVHSEKPLASSAGEVDSIVRILNEAGMAFSYGAVRRYMDVFRHAKTLAHEGEIGDVQAITIRFGKGGLMWTHPHSIDIMCFLACDAPVESVQANLALEPGTTQDNAVDSDPVLLSATIQFENGIVGQIVPEAGLSVDVAGTKAGLSVLGDGAYILHRTYGLSLECKADTQWNFEADGASVSGRLRAFEDLRNAVVHGKPGLIQLSQVAEQHRVLFAMVQSHLEGGRRVSLAEVDPALTVTGRQGGLAA